MKNLDLSIALLPFVCATMLATCSRLEAQEDRTFGEEKRITAVDLVFGFETGAMRNWATDNPVPSNLRAQDFEIFYDGQPRPVVAVEAGAGEWQIVIYFDAALTTSAGLRWAAATLAGRSDELTALGEVTIVVADPAPWLMLASTRDRDRLNASLSQLARFQEGGDELMSLRSEAVTEQQHAESKIDADLLAAVAAEEGRIVRARHDDLLLELSTRGGSGPYRALLVASGGYDLQPADFYRSLQAGRLHHKDADEPTVAGDLAAADGRAAAGDLTAATETLARTLAAYGWVVVPLVAPESDPLKEGVRIGKLRLTGPSVKVEKSRATPSDWEDVDRTVVRLFGARLEGHRKPKRAEAFLELGAALHAQNKLAEAEDALRQALYHFAGDPRTAERQAVAFAHLGALFKEREQTQEANAAFSLARRLDPGVTIGGGGPIAAMLDAVGPLETLAQTTAGGVVRSAEALASALDGLRRRVWLSYQVAGSPDGDLHALEARFKSSRDLVYPGWARSSTPESMAAARARRLLAGEPTGGGLELNATFVAAAGGQPRPGSRRLGEVHLDFVPPAGGAAADAVGAAAEELAEDATADTVLRLTLGVGGPDVEPTVEHRPLGSQTGRESWSYRVAFEMPEERTWLAVVVEDLDTGAWGGRLIEVP